MPLPVLPTNLTWRAFIDYNGPGGERTTMLRFPGDRTQGAVVGVVLAYIAVIRVLWNTAVTVSGLRLSAPNTTVTFPVAIEPFAGLSAGTIQPINYPDFVSLVGRTQSGRKVRYTLYFTSVPSESDFRAGVGSSVALTDWFNFVEDANNSIVAIDASPATMYNYANLGKNSYYQRKARVTS